MERILRYMLTLLGVLLGYPIAHSLINDPKYAEFFGTQNPIIIYTAIMIASGLIIYFLYPILLTVLRKVTAEIEVSMRSRNIVDTLIQLFGLIVGLVIAFLLSSAFNSFPIPGVQWIITICLYLIFGYIGWTIPTHHGKDLISFMSRFRRTSQAVKEEKPIEEIEIEHLPTKVSKVLDTSVIIDGRIIDIFNTQFLEGPLLIPTYVLSELQLISDSSDNLKRNKGRRGLDIVKKLQESFPDEIQILEEDYTDLKDVDSKLIRTAKEHGFKIITNDYNLNKVASVQGISVLNINELANAVKISVLPGEIIDVSLIKAGKEPGQAVAYMEDGTMIVVENSKHLIGQDLPVVVTSALQTSAGRMIFAKPTGNDHDYYSSSF